MTKGKFKSIVTTTAITLAAVGTQAFADDTVPASVEAVDESVIKAIDSNNDNIKHELETQQAVVEDVAKEVEVKQVEAQVATQEVSKAQADVEVAEKAVQETNMIADNAHPENIETTKALQADNLAEQEQTASEIKVVDTKIADQTAKVSEVKSTVEAAKSEKESADADVMAKQANVKTAQDAVSGVGQAEAQTKLAEAKAEVKKAEAELASATKAVKDSKSTDSAKDAKVKAAETDVKVKSDAVDTASAVLEKAKAEVERTKAKLAETNVALKDAQSHAEVATEDVVSVQIGEHFKDDYEAWLEDETDESSTALKYSGVEAMGKSKFKASNKDENKLVNPTDLKTDEQLAMSQVYVDAVKQLGEKLGIETEPYVTNEALIAAKNRAKQYETRALSPDTHGHIENKIENLVLLGSASNSTHFKTLKDVKQASWDSFISTSFDDKDSDWGHLEVNLYAQGGIGAAIANINGQYWMVIVFAQSGTPIEKPQPQATPAPDKSKAKSDQKQAQSAADKAQAELVKAQSSYDNALQLKSEAEKVLADAKSTPHQNQVAENSLRLAEIALKHAKDREATAQKALENFSADTASKQKALKDAEAKAQKAIEAQSAKNEAFKMAQAELNKQETILADLTDAKAKLTAEKDELVKKADELAMKLQKLEAYGKVDLKVAEENYKAAKAALVEKQAALVEAKAKAKTATKALEAVTAKLAEEKAKLAELQAKYTSLNRTHKHINLSNGSIIVVPSVDKQVKNVTAITTKGTSASYSRADRAKSLPQTGEKESLMAMFGIAMGSSLGLAGFRKRRG
ncbi:SEC10/PgrA surface exclusion domain-containing protein [Streptococcus phocae subsp. phocae]